MAKFCMRFKDLDLNLLVALDHMLTQRSVTKAAERMNITQSAMSSALGRLREFFDDPLLVQVGRRLELTPNAQAIQERVRDILVRVEATIDLRPAFCPKTMERQFNIHMSDYSVTVLAPHMLTLAQEEGAISHFRFLATSQKPYTLLEKGEADLLVAPVQLCSDNHPSQHLFFDEYVCVFWSGSVHAKRELTLEGFSGAGHVVTIPVSGGRSIESELQEQAGIRRHEQVMAFTFSALPYLLIGTDRVATIQRRLAEILAQSLPIDIRPLPFALDPIDQIMQWHGYREQDSGIVWLRTLLARAALRMQDARGPALSGDERPAGQAHP
jgi:LysR family nod box-dependent transcriptional activator